MQRLFNQLVPFLLIGIAIVAFALGIVLLAYLFLLGAFVGLILFIASWIKDKFFPSKAIMRVSKTKTGRVYDSDEWKKL